MRVMHLILLPCLAALVACAPSPREANMRNSSPFPMAAAARESEEAPAAPARRADSPAEAEGRLTLSTAFVRLGPGEHLTIELRDGRTLALRDVVIRPHDYCGVHVRGGSAGKRYCGGFGEVAAARPGGTPVPDLPEPAVLGAAEPTRD